MTRDDALAFDAADPLAPLRELFELPPGLIYLDGNSLGPLPRATAARLQQVLRGEWGRGLIGSWNDAGWMALPHRVGDKIARLVGAGPGELVVADSTSVNLYKALSAALALVRESGDAQRSVVVTEAGNFPTDLYIAEAVAREHGCTLRRVADPADLPAALDDRCAVLLLTHVDYRSGRMHDMAALSAAAHAAGAFAVWDLAHSAGAVPVDLHADGADFAVGCGYKYLNGGPGAPAFVWAHPRHAARCEQPLSGWMGHAAPFDFSPGYRPAAGSARFLCGTPAVLATTALECGVDTVLAAEVHGQGRGAMAALRAKSLALTRLFADTVAAGCPELACVTPADDARRGSQVSFAHPSIGYAVVQALIARGVVGDYRADADGSGAGILRFGFAPLYVRHVDAWDAAAQLRAVLESAAWRRPEFQRRQAVT